VHFLEKRPLTVGFSKFCSESFQGNTDGRVVFKFCEIWLTVNRWNRALLTWQKNNNKILQLSVLRRWRPQSVWASPRQCTQSASDLI